MTAAAAVDPTSCDVPACCNPCHLQAETDAINKLCSIVSRRHTHGERSGTSKLTDATSRHAFDLIQRKVPHPSIAIELSVSRLAINDIERGRTCTHVAGMKRTRVRAHGDRITSAIANEVVAQRERGATQRATAARMGIGLQLVRDIERGDVLIPRSGQHHAGVGYPSPGSAGE